MTALSVLKNVLCLNQNQMHVDKIEDKVEVLHKDKDESKGRGKVEFLDKADAEARRAVGGEVFTARDVVMIHARPYKRVQCRCPICMQKCPGYDTPHDTESRWRAPNLHGVSVYVGYVRKRIQCPEHGVQSEYIPWADGTSRFTKSFNDEISWLIGRLPKTDIAYYMNIDWRTAGNCLRYTLQRLEPDRRARRMANLRRICVDETSYEKGHKYITVVYDMDRNQVVWVRKGNNYEVFKQFCEELTPEERNKIEIVAGDGAQWITRCVKEFFPNAVRCVDPFHVCEWANETLNEVRMSVYAKAKREYEMQKNSTAQANIEFDRSYGTGGRKGTFTEGQQQEFDKREALFKGVKRSKYAVCKNPENCTKDQAEKIRVIEREFPDLFNAYQFKERLRAIIHMKEDPEAAAQKLDEWIADARNSDMEPIRSLAEKVARNREGILQAVINRANSAKSEATNTTIKLLIKMGRGYRNLDNLIALVYLKCSSLEIPLFNRPSRRTLDPDKEDIGKKIEQAIQQEQALAKGQMAVTE